MIDTFLSGIFLFSTLAILGGLLALLARLRAGEGARVHLPADGGIWGTLLPGLALVVLVAAPLTVVDPAAFQEWLARPEALTSGPGGIGDSLES